MSISSKTPSRTAPEADRPSISLEARLASAEKEASMALDTFDFDELILVASDALKQKPQTPSKSVIKSRKNLLWARSHAYRHKSLHELALKDAKAALKIDPDDIAAYIRTAVLLKEAGHDKQAIGCLDKAESLANALEPSVKAMWLRKIGKQRQKVATSSALLVDRLPNELLIEVALHLDAPSRAVMSQTCRSWQRILIPTPRLWTSMTVVIKQKRLPDSKAAEWLDHIRMCSRRCGHSLEKVEFSGHFPGNLLDKVICILRMSSHSLRDITIPTRLQERCYELLYRHCPRLELLDFTSQSDITVQGTSLQSNACAKLVTAPPEDLPPFSLKVLRTVPNRPIPFLSKHLHALCVLDGYDPFHLRSNDPDLSPEDKRLFQSLAENLEEWTNRFPNIALYMHLGHHEPIEPIELTFSKLTKLRSFFVNPRHHFRFPNLLEVKLEALLDNHATADELVRTLASSPMLRKLEIGCIVSEHVSGRLQQAMQSLHHLEEFSLMSETLPDFLSNMLLPRRTQGEAGRTELEFPLPNLQRLALNMRHLDTNKLAFALLVRDKLRTGDDFAAATRWASDRLKGNRARATASGASPFQRGSTVKRSAASPAESSGLHLRDAAKVCALQSLALKSLDEVPDHVERALRSVVPELLFQYDPL